MNNFSAEVRDAVNQHSIKALEVCAMEFNRLTDKFTPVWKDNLRRSKHVETTGSEVFAVTGDSKTQKYINKQYYESLRHRGNYQSGLLDLTALHRGSGGRRRTGRGKAYLYSHAYRLAVKLGEIQKMDKPEWYERGARDAGIMQIMGEVFVNYL